MKKQILPVIHVQDLDQALRNTEIAQEQGADGVFLINHEIGAFELLEIVQKVCSQFSNWWIGVNCLGQAPADVFRYLFDEITAVWVDNARIDESIEAQTEAKLIAQARQESGWPGLYFGGVAFKYQRPVKDLEKAAKIATDFMDVVTTSGPGTGQEAAIDKIKRMKAALGEKSLGIASGVTSENVELYLPYIDYFLVATGISKDFYNLDPALLHQLAQKVKEFSS